MLDPQLLRSDLTTVATALNKRNMKLDVASDSTTRR